MLNLDELLFAIGWEGVVGLFTGICTVVGAAFHFSGVRLGERKGRAKTEAETVNYLVDAADKIIQARGDEITRLGGEVKVLRSDLDRCEERHDDCEKRMVALTERLDALPEIEALMKGPVATYPHGAAE